ncbi:MAG: hypothetical protein HDR43_00005, partial [Mycoplasma sp.]|nr:hypothetical protein [Mycoplasma sp.]
MNKKMKRITLIVASSALLVPTIGVSTLALTNAIIKNNSTHDNASVLDTSQDIYKYLYQGKYYNSYDDIVQNILWSNRDTINQQMYYGNLNKAIFDLETKRIDIGQMRPFEWADQNGRLEAAWINALGQHTRSYEEAKSSFINKGLVKHEYVDMFGNLHYTYDSALASNQRGVKFDELAYYKIKNEKNETININPLNKKDIKEFTRIALNSLGNNSESNPFKLIFLEEQKNQKNTNTKSFVNVSN